MYRWLVFAHVVAVFGFLLAHGVAVAVAFRLRGEREVARIRALLDLSLGTTFLLHVSWYLLLIAGIAAGFLGNWWGQGWIWAALGLLLVLTVAMGPLATRPYMRLREYVGASLPAHPGAKGTPAKDTATPAPEVVSGTSEAVDPRRLAALIAATHPWRLTVMGFGGLALILWLMMFKPV